MPKEFVNFYTKRPRHQKPRASAIATILSEHGRRNRNAGEKLAKSRRSAGHDAGALSGGFGVGGDGGQPERAQKTESSPLLRWNSAIVTSVMDEPRRKRQHRKGGKKGAHCYLARSSPPRHHLISRAVYKLRTEGTATAAPPTGTTRPLQPDARTACR